MSRRCIICDARIRNLNPRVKTCGPTCTRFYHEHKEAVDRGEKVLKFEDAVRRDIERAETAQGRSDAPAIYYRRNPFQSLRRATGCTYNKGTKCMVPSLCKINATGGCDGFKAKELPKQIDGD